MNPMARRFLGLIAIYALVLQSLLAGVAATVAAANGAIICTTQDGTPALADHAACLSCAVCSPAADAPQRAVLEIARAFAIVDPALPSYTRAALPARHQPQAARAPPA